MKIVTELVKAGFSEKERNIILILLRLSGNCHTASVEMRVEEARMDLLKRRRRPRKNQLGCMERGGTYRTVHVDICISLLCTSALLYYIRLFQTIYPGCED